MYIKKMISNFIKKRLLPIRRINFLDAHVHAEIVLYEIIFIFLINLFVSYF